MKNKIFYILIMFLIISFSTSFSIVKADEYTLLEPLPCIEGTGNNCTTGETIPKININTYIAYVFKFSIALAAFLAVVMIIWGGFQYLISESPIKKMDGKATITNAVLGLAGVLVSYLILRTIDPRLVMINTTIPPIAIKDIGDVNKFIDRLGEDIQKLNEVNKAEVSNLQNLNIDIQKSIDALEKKKEDEGLTPEEDSNLASFKSELKRNEAKIIKIFAVYRGSNNFSDAIIYLGKPGNYITDSPNTSKLGELTDIGKIALDDYLYQINSLDEYANKLKTLNDYENATMVSMRKNFYIEQIKEEQRIAKDIISYLKYKDYPEMRSRYEPNLKKDLEDYSKPDSLGAGYRTDNELMKEYQTLKEMRVKAIQGVLGINTPQSSN